MIFCHLLENVNNKLSKLDLVSKNSRVNTYYFLHSDQSLWQDLNLSMYIVHTSRNNGQFDYSHLFNKRRGWNKRGGGAKVAKSLNVEVGKNVEGGIFWKKRVQI